MENVCGFSKFKFHKAAGLLAYPGPTTLRDFISGRRYAHVT